MENKNSHIKKGHKIVFFDHTPFVGGAQLSLMQHLIEMKRRGDDFILVCANTAKDSNLSSLYTKNKIPFRTIEIPRLKVLRPAVLIRLLKSVFVLRKLLREENAELLVTNTVRTAIYGSLAAKLCGVKIIWLIRDFTFPCWLFFGFSVFPKKIVFNAMAVRNYYRRYLPAEKKAAVVYVGRDLYRRVSGIDSSSVENTRSNWRANGKLVVGYAGRFVAWKGPQILIRAIAYLDKRGIKDVIAVMAGSGAGQAESNETECRTLAKELGLDARIIFTGFISDMATFLPALDVLVLPSIEPEPFSSTVVDAMMARVPVIGTAIGGTPEAISDKETGLLVPPGDPKALGDAMLLMKKNHELKMAIIEQAYRLAINNFTVSKTTAALVKIYREEIVN